jgi:hypothetical protein
VIASIPTQLDSEYAIQNTGGTTTFDETELVVQLILSDGTIVTAEKATYHEPCIV